MSWEVPERPDPTRKITMLARNTGRRPKRSPSFPQSGVVTVDASRYDVTTQDRWFAPPRSLTIVGSAVATIVWSSAASSIANIRPPKITQICRCVIGASWAAAVSVTDHPPRMDLPLRTHVGPSERRVLPGRRDPGYRECALPRRRRRFGDRVLLRAARLL